VIIGEGSERARLEKMAGSHITFLGSQPQTVLRDHYRRCRAFIFPGIEDFGITPLEAQASGRPVIALGKGGALETVQNEKTGLFFEEQTAPSLIAAVEKFEASFQDFHPKECRAQAERFSSEHFRATLSAFLGDVVPSS
jgi:glycosyltransferase involved in cell wall biosynthesis